VALVLIACCPDHGLHGQHQVCETCGGPVEQIPMLPANYFTPSELDWVESAARRAAMDRIVKAAKAADALMELARKVRMLRRAP
jgi:hypothetical protein